MNIGIRVFLVENDGSLRPLPVRRFDGLLRGETLFPEYAGKKMRYAMISVELDNRKAVEIVRADYGFVSFDACGRLDEKDMARQMRQVANTLSVPGQESNFIDLRPQIAQQRYRAEFKWTPTAAEITAIERAVLWKGKRPVLRIRPSIRPRKGSKAIPTPGSPEVDGLPTT